MPLSDTTRSEMREIIARYPHARSALLPMLHLVQSVQGRVSQAGIQFCARQLGLTDAEVAAVATFYTKEGVDELAEQAVALMSGKGPVKPKIIAAQIAFNLVPQIDKFQDNGYTKEEMKMFWETRKIFGDPDIRVNATTVRVPVFFGHSEVVNVETRRKLTADEARSLLAKAPGVVVVDTRKAGGYPTPAIEAAGNDSVYVGRIREDISHERGLNFWIVSDNIRKGAATNSVQIAEILVRDYL